MLRKIVKIGNSLYVSVDKNEADYIGLKKGDLVNVIISKLKNGIKTE